MTIIVGRDVLHVVVYNNVVAGWLLQESLEAAMDSGRAVFRRSGHHAPAIRWCPAMLACRSTSHRDHVRGRLPEHAANLDPPDPA
jgi:hypothetical protein